jgi:phenylalanine-4-hydroxylase
MRTLEHLAYTPAPDIVHEAAGHAPILADEEYASYLKSYGEVARRAIYSSKDMDVYEAIRTLSEVKEEPSATPEQITRAQKSLEGAIAANNYVSEATYLARMFWWTVEYGLVGSTQAPKIYGAGLLSSVGESFACLGDRVAKLPLSLDCVNMSYDITRPQPQLFTTPDFKFLKALLEEYSKTLAYRKGGVEGLVKAKTAQTVTTTVFDNGLQVSGCLKDFWVNDKGEPIYLKWDGPTALAQKDQELAGQGVDRHRDGFSCPIGKVKTRRGWVEACEMIPSDLHSLTELEYDSGIIVRGNLINTQLELGLLTFSHCTVSKGSQMLFDPSWGEFDLALGCRVVSVFGGAADRVSYLKATGKGHLPRKAKKVRLSGSEIELAQLFSELRQIRNGAEKKVDRQIQIMIEKLKALSITDWLIRFEMIEILLANGASPALLNELLNETQNIVANQANIKVLFDRGLRAIGWKE